MPVVGSGSDVGREVLAGEGGTGGDEVGGSAIEHDPTAVAAGARAEDTVRRVLSFRWLRARKGFGLRVGGWCHDGAMNSDVERVWDGYADAFDEEADHGLCDPQVRAAWQALLTRLLPEQPVRIADLGCGTGSLAVLLAEQANRVSGVDISGERGLHLGAVA